LTAPRGVEEEGKTSKFTKKKRRIRNRAGMTLQRIPGIFWKPAAKVWQGSGKDTSIVGRLKRTRCQVSLKKQREKRELTRSAGGRTTIDCLLPLHDTAELPETRTTVSKSMEITELRRIVVRE